MIGSESKYLEFKQAFSDTLFKTVSAFANFHDGTILIGLADDGQVVGVNNVDELKLTIENTINDSIVPRPYYEFSTLTESGSPILMLKVYQGEHTPYLFKGKAYMRSDTSTIRVDQVNLKT